MFRRSSLTGASRHRIADAFNYNLSSHSCDEKSLGNPNFTSINENSDESSNTHLTTSNVGLHLLKENIATFHYLCQTDAPHEIVNDFLHKFPELLDGTKEVKNIKGWINEKGQSPLDVVNHLSKSCKCGQCNINRKQVLNIFKCFRVDKPRKGCEPDNCKSFDAEASLDYDEDLLSTSGSAGDSDEEESAKYSNKTKFHIHQVQYLRTKSELTEENIITRDRMEYGLRHEMECLWYFHGDRIRLLLNQIDDIKYDKKLALEDLQQGKKHLEKLHGEAESININPAGSTRSQPSNNYSIKNKLMILKYATSIKKRMIERDYLQSAMDKVCYDTGIAKIYCQSLEQRITDLEIAEARLEKYYNEFMDSVFGPTEKKMRSLVGTSYVPNCQKRTY